jgi:hypothetical protein
MGLCGRLAPEFEYLCPPGHRLEETIAFLKAEVEDHRQELQTGETPGLQECRKGGHGIGLQDLSCLLSSQQIQPQADFPREHLSEGGGTQRRSDGCAPAPGMGCVGMQGSS